MGGGGFSAPWNPPGQDSLEHSLVAIKEETSEDSDDTPEDARAFLGLAGGFSAYDNMTCATHVTSALATDRVSASQ